MSGRLVVVGGGARSGKSRFALEAAQRRVLGPRVFIATAEALDDEMRERAARHRAERGDAFTTLEEPLDVCSSVESSGAAAIVVDCLTLWISNLLLAGRPAPSILAEVERLIGAARAARATTWIVTNEVGMGVVPETPLGRAFRDLAGRANQLVAAAADEVYLGTMGLILRLKPSALSGGDAP